MGSGHFLVEAVDPITDQLLKFLNQFPINPVNFAPGADPHVASWNHSASRASPSIRDKLTDINLLKRHVLKRCIYGVDLNPMAVELAKVSLWLDAFTLGAPLNFLDHHLRCGNSLIGATFKDLEEGDGRARSSASITSRCCGPSTTSFSSARWPMPLLPRWPTRSVSTTRPGRLSRATRSCWIWCSPHISACPWPRRLVTSGSDLDLLESREVPGHRSTETRRRSSSPRSRRWRSGPTADSSTGRSSSPRSSSGSSDANQRQIKHKERIKAGTAGFDVVVGNPPYDVLSVKELGESVKEVISYFRETPRFADAVGRKLNLYRCFVALALGILKQNGKFGMIIPLGIIGDLSASAIRSRMVTTSIIDEIVAFPERTTPLDESSRKRSCLHVCSR